MITCHRCHTQNNELSRFCSNCGSALTAPAQDEQLERRLNAGRSQAAKKKRTNPVDQYSYDFYRSKTFRNALLFAVSIMACIFLIACAAFVGLPAIFISYYSSLFG